jgi:hypothetical protein
LKNCVEDSKGGRFGRFFPYAGCFLVQFAARNAIPRGREATLVDSMAPEPISARQIVSESFTD